jgi:hypothetical protein
LRAASRLSSGWLLALALVTGFAPVAAWRRKALLLQRCPASRSAAIFCRKQCYGRAYREIGAESGRTCAGRGAIDRRAKGRACRRGREAQGRKKLRPQGAAAQGSGAAEHLRERSGYRSDARAGTGGCTGESSLDQGRGWTRSTEIRAARKKFEDEAEFYKKKQLPPEVRKG